MMWTPLRIYFLYFIEIFAKEATNRRNSEFFTHKPAANTEQEWSSRRYSNLKNFTHDIPPFVPHNTKLASTTSGVEILNLKNTTVLENRQPEGVYVVKENSDSYRIVQQQQPATSNERRSSQRMFFTLDEPTKKSTSSSSRPTSASQQIPAAKFAHPIYPLKDSAAKKSTDVASSSRLG